jgi:hypothetical protein
VFERRTRAALFPLFQFAVHAVVGPLVLIPTRREIWLTTTRARPPDEPNATNHRSPHPERGHYHERGFPLEERYEQHPQPHHSGQSDEEDQTVESPAPSVFGPLRSVVDGASVHGAAIIPQLTPLAAPPGTKSAVALGLLRGQQGRPVKENPFNSFCGRQIRSIQQNQRRFAEHCLSTVCGRPGMQSPARVSDGTTPHALREVATIAKCTEEFVSATSLCWDNRRLLPIIQGHVNNIRGEYSPVFETNASDIAPLKSLIPFSFEVRENPNPHFGIIKLYGQDISERLPGA